MKGFLLAQRLASSTPAGGFISKHCDVKARQRRQRDQECRKALKVVPEVTSSVAIVICVLNSLPVWSAVVTVFPGDPDWVEFIEEPTSSAEITSTNPRSGLGSLELLKADPVGSALINEPLSGEAFGTFGDLQAVAFEWYIDPGSSAALPPDLALRVFPFGDPRTFFLHWDTCSPVVPCTPHPTGSWQFTDLFGRLSIQPAEDGTPPPTLGDIPLDAPIVGIHLRTSFAFGGPWHGFVDNVTLGFTEQEPVTYNFEVSPVPEPGSLVLLWFGLVGIFGFRRQSPIHRR